jgi:hypothetical protein
MDVTAARILVVAIKQLPNVLALTVSPENGYNHQQIVPFAGIFIHEQKTAAIPKPSVPQGRRTVSAA